MKRIDRIILGAIAVCLSLIVARLYTGEARAYNVYDYINDGKILKVEIVNPRECGEDQITTCTGQTMLEAQCQK